MKMNFDLKTYLTEKQRIINKELENILLHFDNNNQLINAMEHSLMAGGKRVRPILSIAAARACKKEYSPALPAACAIEMIHTYSLIHDDLPAMDDDDLRRGLPTCHNKFGESTAILAGDALLTHAFNILAEPETLFNNFPDTKTRLKLIAKISQAAGINGMVKGQILDMQAGLGVDLSEHSKLKHLEKIHDLKTGKMILVSVETGALSVGADQKLIDKLKIYARKIGLAFQVADDILNIEGDPVKMGKAAGSDIINDKMTFPGIIGLEESKKYAKSLIDDAIKAISEFDESAQPLRSIARYIVNRDH
ncbi:MAG: polyprenyl synthetase family protein [Desulfobacula sp.]|nr:polyprenyl synthetase family protein [Desulfobacula sp.]